jgi:hypothetical protein
MGAFCLAVLSLVVSAMIQQSLPWLLSMAKQSNTVIVKPQLYAFVRSVRNNRVQCALGFDDSTISSKYAVWVLVGTSQVLASIVFQTQNIHSGNRWLKLCFFLKYSRNIEPLDDIFAAKSRAVGAKF